MFCHSGCAASVCAADVVLKGRVTLTAHKVFWLWNKVPLLYMLKPDELFPYVPAP